MTPELDEDFNGLGDDFQKRYRLTRQQAEAALNGLGDFDVDLAGLLMEFRWDTIPLEVPGLTTGNARDWDGDSWLDGLEIAYWDTNQDPLVPVSQGLAFRDQDSYVDSDGDGIPNQHDPDSDGDGLLDGEEVLTYGTYPESADSDCGGAGSCPAPSDTKYRSPERAEIVGDLIGDKDEYEYWQARPESGGPLGDECDRDGIPQIRDADSDGDTLLDGDEILSGGDPCNADEDGDGLGDGQERALRTDASNPDTDGDGMPDGWEVEFGLNPHVDDSQMSTDGDQLSNIEEYNAGTDPRLADTDRDLLLDHEEIALGTDPLWWDTDNDGMPDGWETLYGLSPKSNDASLDQDNDIGDTDDDGIPEYVHTNYFEYATGRPGSWDETVSGPWLGGTKPDTVDTDLDQISDGYEVATGDDPTTPIPRFDQDADFDGLILADELDRHTSPAVVDSDDDGVCDGGGNIGCTDQVLGTPNAPGEVNHYRSNPILRDSDGDGLTDGEEVILFDVQRSGSTGDFDGDLAESIVDPDSDNDGLGDYAEAIELPTEPHLADTDGDLLDDYEELVLSIARGHPTDPTNRDTDGDLLSDGDEVLNIGTWPDFADTDDDGLTDDEEVTRYGTSPFLSDTDRDRMPDKWEVDNRLDPTRDDAAEDPDRDGVVLGLTNYEEYALGLDGGTSTDPHNADTDGDLINDYFEVLFGLSPTSSNLNTDTDGDGLNDLGEFLLRTDPNAQDTDEDGLSDFEEAGTNDPALLVARLTPSDPTLRDSDLDGVEDLREMTLWEQTRGPGSWRTDYDQDAPSTIIGAWSNLRDADSDNDGFDDGQEFLVFTTRPDRADTDGDGDADAAEVLLFFTSPHDPASNSQRRALTAGADADADGLSDMDEAFYGTNSSNADTDHDGLPDGFERAAWGSRVGVNFDADAYANNLLDPDSDNDGIPDGIEFIASALPRQAWYITDPGAFDTDGDGLGDHEEAGNGLELLLRLGRRLRSGAHSAFRSMLIRRQRQPMAEGVRAPAENRTPGTKTPTTIVSSTAPSGSCGATPRTWTPMATAALTD